MINSYSSELRCYFLDKVMGLISSHGGGIKVVQGDFAGNYFEIQIGDSFKWTCVNGLTAQSLEDATTRFLVNYNLEAKANNG